MLTAYHLETDGFTECTNKIVNQILQYHMECNQSGWVKALPLVHFNIMNTVNKSTGFSPFQLCISWSTCVVLPLINNNIIDWSTEAEHTRKIVTDIEMIAIVTDIEMIAIEAQNNLLRAKISQATQANKSRGLTFLFVIDRHVCLSTLN
jgi:hypothetical protein